MCETKYVYIYIYYVLFTHQGNGKEVNVGICVLHTSTAQRMVVTGWKILVTGAL